MKGEVSWTMTRLELILQNDDGVGIYVDQCTNHKYQDRTQIQRNRSLAIADEDFLYYQSGQRKHHLSN